ncbi:MAG: FHA domain-containing protein, partial [Polyangiales bacterium]
MLPLLLRIQNHETSLEEAHAFRSSPVRVGRNELNDCVLKDPFVSQWHAVIWFDEETTRYVDLGSTNGTIVDGQRVPANVPIAVNRQNAVHIGPLQLHFVRGYVPPQQLRSHRRTSFEADAPTIIAGEGSNVTMAIDAEAFRATSPQGYKSFEDLNTEVKQAKQRLQPKFEQDRKAWQKVFEGIQEEVGKLPEELKAGALIQLCEELEGLAREPDVQGIARDLELNPAALGEVDARAFLERLVPEHKEQLASVNPAAAMERVGALLEAFGQAYVELRKGYEQFGKDMALRTNDQDTPLRRTQDGQEVLSYLLDWNADGLDRVQELTRAFAELAIHQVAMLNGLMEGCRSLLRRLSPQEVSGQAPSQSTAITNNR